MTELPITNSGTRKWLIVSWAHIDHQDAAYGRLLDTVEGTYEEAREEALKWANEIHGGAHKPIGIVGAIE